MSSRLPRNRRCCLETNQALEEKDLVIIGGGVAGYVAAIKAGQEGMKVSN
jgi:dihydrolipoamide dehydrogenase